MIEATKFILRSKVSFVLTERFNQDILEEYFGHQRALGRRNDNPNYYQFKYQANTLAKQRQLHNKKTGNTGGRSRKKKKYSWDGPINNEPMKKGNLERTFIERWMSHTTFRKIKKSFVFIFYVVFLK